MSNRTETLTVYLTPEEKAQLKEWSNETGKSISELGRDAVLEYLDHDRVDRVESELRKLHEKLDRVEGAISDGATHAHKGNMSMSNGPTKVTERAREILRLLQRNYGEVIKNDDVVTTIENVAGADDRTIRKYKSVLKRRGLLFAHPGETAVWTTDSDQWLTWVKDYTQLNGADAAETIVEQYPARIQTTPEGVSIELTEEA